ncbi:MAG TPA: AAA family ATPase [Thermoanaerobaculia bacterium]|nr:AAA family ATPase [Thermoanaerobaculia bacterium]
MYIQNLKVQNLRCFREAQLQLRYPNEPNPPDTPFPNVTLLLGNNGAGKTTALKSLAIGVLARVIARSGFVSYHLVRRGEAEAAVEATLVPDERDGAEEITPGTPLSLLSKIVRDGDYEEILPQEGPPLPTLFEDDSPAWFIVGYGATRRVETGEYSSSSEEKRRRLRYRRVAGLFEEGVALTPLTAWLPIFQRERPEVHDAALRLINRLLPGELRFHGEMEGEEKNLREREYLFEHRGLSVPFGALSDGYRAYLGWVADLVYHLASFAKPGDELWDYSGVILIDEIDLHLHPEWQRSVIGTVAKALPRMQLVFSTHSPIVAGTLKRENIFVMETAPDGSSEVRQLEERIYGLNADQVLISSYFNLNSTRAPGFERSMRRLTQRAWAGDEGAALEMLRQLAGKTEQDK